MVRRIFGLESEYGFVFCNKSRKAYPPERALEFLFQGILMNSWSRDAFLPNGARVYQDTGSHPEYSTPECDRVRDVVIHDKAGERILSRAVDFAFDHLHEEGVDGSLFVLKNNTDAAGNSYGCHENYLIDRNVTFWRLSRTLIPFFVTRQIFAGAGGLVPDGEGRVMFVLSPRALHIREKISCSTTSSRPIINTRDEPHADPQKYRRLHIIVGDSNMSEVSNYLKIGATALVLQVIEEGGLHDRMSIEDPIRAIREISMDPTLTRKVRLEGGRELTAIEIQREYLDSVQAFLDKEGSIPAVSQEILSLWDRALTDLEKDPSRLGREFDWVIKHKALESYRSKKGLEWSDPILAMVDYQYHDVHLKRGLYNIMVQNGMVDRLVEEAEIVEAMVKPPQTTRAKHRSFTVDWTYMRLNDPPQETVHWSDPFRHWEN
jgi:proteasome accessory factor A